MKTKKEIEHTKMLEYLARLRSDGVISEEKYNQVKEREDEIYEDQIVE